MRNVPANYLMANIIIDKSLSILFCHKNIHLGRNESEDNRRVCPYQLSLPSELLTVSLLHVA